VQTDCEIVYFENGTDFKSLDESGEIRVFNDGYVERFGIELIGSDGNVSTIYFGKDLAKRIAGTIEEGLTRG
jgi:hypothetical protein